MELTEAEVHFLSAIRTRVFFDAKKDDKKVLIVMQQPQPGIDDMGAGISMSLQPSDHKQVIPVVTVRKSLKAEGGWIAQFLVKAARLQLVGAKPKDYNHGLRHYPHDVSGLEHVVLDTMTYLRHQQLPQGCQEQYTCPAF